MPFEPSSTPSTGTTGAVVVRLDHVLADGNHVAVRFRVLGSIGGQRFEVPIADFFEVRDGLIVYDLGVFDNAGRPCRP